jgi:hypothetical protein
MIFCDHWVRGYTRLVDAADQDRVPQKESNLLEELEDRQVE